MVQSREVDFTRLSSTDYYDFVATYGGHGVTTSSAFRAFADIQELRWVAFVLGKAATRSTAPHREPAG
ncbi:hypothetical protein [Saccharopolyspora endophytica]|uniref:hypothetical protein n=1 Tax=Saccharopolyspora endophytica TaxID=543886 RepID=UPI001FE80960|nr:hypothetical protein [Saccharopolyspora endophytica]